MDSPQHHSSSSDLSMDFLSLSCLDLNSAELQVLLVSDDVEFGVAFVGLDFLDMVVHSACSGYSDVEHSAYSALVLLNHSGCLEV